MAEPPGAQPALAIDTVEWLAMADNVLTVAVTGRWRRRASWRGRPVLVIESQGRRYRFPSIAEPPSVAGATPGSWRMTFTIPAWLAPQLKSHCWLQFGGASIPLPGVMTQASPPEPGFQLGAEDEPEASPGGDEPAEVPEAPQEGEPAEPGPAPSAEREATEVPPEQPEWHPDDVLAAAADLGERIRQLERERREAEQRAHEEQARRLELEEQRATFYPQLSAAQERVRELESELASARENPWRERFEIERAIARRAPAATVARPPTSAAGAEFARMRLGWERAMIEVTDWRRVAELEREIRDHMRRAELLYDVIEELRGVLDSIRGVEPSVSVVEPERLDAALIRLRETIPEPVSEEGDTPVSSTPLTSGSHAEALAQGASVSETGVSPSGESPGEAAATSAPPTHALPTPAAPSAPAPPAPVARDVPSPTRKSWLLRALRVVAKEDRVVAGRMILGALPASHLMCAEPVAYDLVLSDAGVIQVSVGEERTSVVRSVAPRGWQQVEFRVTGELDSFARLVLAGRFRRRLGRLMAEIGGSRRALSALTSLVRTPLGLAELYAAGMRLEPPLAFRLVAAMIDPKAAASHRFTIAHRGPAESWYLRVSGSERPIVTDAAPLGPVATTIVSGPELLLGVLAGLDQPGALVRGDTEPLALLSSWVQGAKSD